MEIAAYRIMCHLGIMDLGVVICNYLVNALMMIANSYFDYNFSKVSFYFYYFDYMTGVRPQSEKCSLFCKLQIANSLTNGFWVGEASMVLILAVNRFIVLLDLNLPDWLSEKLFYNVRAFFDADLKG